MAHLSILSLFTIHLTICRGQQREKDDWRMSVLTWLLNNNKRNANNFYLIIKILWSTWSVWYWCYQLFKLIRNNMVMEKSCSWGHEIQQKPGNCRGKIKIDINSLVYHSPQIWSSSSCQESPLAIRLLLLIRVRASSGMNALLCKERRSRLFFFFLEVPLLASALSSLLF